MRVFSHSWPAPPCPAPLDAHTAPTLRWGDRASECGFLLSTPTAVRCPVRHSLLATAAVSSFAIRPGCSQRPHTAMGPRIVPATTTQWNAMERLSVPGPNRLLLSPSPRLRPASIQQQPSGTQWTAVLSVSRRGPVSLPSFAPHGPIKWNTMASATTQPAQ